VVCCAGPFYHDLCKNRLVDHPKTTYKYPVFNGYGSHLVLTIQKLDRTVFLLRKFIFIYKTVKASRPFENQA
jgi:hypothetical protein